MAADFLEANGPQKGHRAASSRCHTTRNATAGGTKCANESGQRHLPPQERPWVDQATAGICDRLRVSVDGPRYFVMHMRKTLGTGGPEHPDRRADIHVLSD